MVSVCLGVNSSSQNVRHKVRQIDDERSEALEKMGAERPDVLV